jgi:hypothetical protein
MSAIKQSGEPFTKPLIIGYLTLVQIKALPKDSNAEILIDVEKRAGAGFWASANLFKALITGY